MVKIRDLGPKLRSEIFVCCSCIYANVVFPQPSMSSPAKPIGTKATLQAFTT